MGVTTGWDQRLAVSKEWRVPIEFREYNYWACKLVNGSYQPATYQGTSVSAYAYKIPSGGAVGMYGSDVSAYDGYYGYRDAPYKASVPAYGYFDITSSRFKAYSTAASAFGFTASAETSLSATRLQAIRAGGTYVYVFGYHPGAEGMRVFYAY